MRNLWLFFSLSLSFSIANAAQAQVNGGVPVRLLSDVPGVALDAYGVFERGGPPASRPLCAPPCETTLAPGKYQLRYTEAGSAPKEVRPKLRLREPVDVFVGRDDLSHRRRRQRIVGIVLATVGLIVFVPGAVAAGCRGRRDSSFCDDEFAEGLVLGSLPLALGGLFIGLSFGPQERVQLSTYPYGSLR